MNIPIYYVFVFQYTVSSANTWEQKSIAIVGDTSGTWLTSNDTGIALVFSLGQGTTYASSTVGSWHSGNYHGSTSEQDFIGNASATFFITGVQLEVGDSASIFEHRSFGEELALCQRYYFSLNYPDSTRTIWMYAIDQSNSAAGYRRSSYMFPTAMRTTPTMSADFTGSGGTGGVDSAAPWTGRNSVSFFMNGISSGNDYAYADDVVAQAEL